ncbi:restriction endonuclease subunit S [Zeaxanthinibacter sp. PT1]|uniref:restriction endonuclease subunit S n=1 Tax=Zeaxanthinibacter TaxID=561554 RepID=UPI00234A1A4D|nr:restriction endonuclease subunit S [Zeaxanthinibacter sp. PT1]MDC6350475.1 restriction endonuclease subunit S [Zeaxanthinibacter sp. PT1]
MMQVLGEIASIRFGPHLSANSQGVVKYLQASHFSEWATPDLFSNSYLSEPCEEKYLLQPNDVILAGKGLRIFAWAYEEEFEKAVASSLFYVIRTNPELIHGKYLAAYLNSDRIQHQLKSIGAGVTITSIPKKELEQISIAIPEMKKQLHIVQLLDLLDQQITLSQQILKARITFKKGVINQIIK